MKELEILHEKVASLVSKYQQCKKELEATKKSLEDKNLELAEAQMQINMLKPAVEEAHSTNAEKKVLQEQITTALDEVQKIIGLLNVNDEIKE